MIMFLMTAVELILIRIISQSIPRFKAYTIK